MKRILLLTPFYKPFVGGAERFAEEVAIRAPNSVAVDVYTTRTRRALPRREIVRGVTVYRLGFGCRYDKFLFPFLATAKASFRTYDRTHAVMASYAGAAALFIYWLKRTPYVLTLQSGTLDTPEYARMIRFIAPLYRAIHRNARMVHAVSGSLRDRALLFGVPPERIKVIPNGIDYVRYTDSHILRIPLRIVVLARLEKVKGVQYAIEAMEGIIARFPEAELIIAGNGSLRGALESLAREKTLQKKIVFKGALMPEEVPAFLMTGTVFVCPSLAEGFGIVILEAMAAGCAVVAADTGGIPDIVNDGVDGLLVPVADAHALAAAVIRVLNDSTLRATLARAGMVRARGFDWQKLASRIHVLWK